MNAQERKDVQTQTLKALWYNTSRKHEAIYKEVNAELIIEIVGQFEEGATVEVKFYEDAPADEREQIILDKFGRRKTVFRGKYKENYEYDEDSYISILRRRRNDHESHEGWDAQFIYRSVSQYNKHVRQIIFIFYDQKDNTFKKEVITFDDKGNPDRVISLELK